MVSPRTRLAHWWKRHGVEFQRGFLLLIVIGISIVLFLQNSEEFSSSAFQASNFLVFLLVNLNIVFLCILVFLVGRNVLKLILDRRRNIPGARLKSRLVTAFVLLTLLPTIILFVVSGGLLSRAMEGWFSNQVEDAVGGAVTVARHHYRFLEGYLEDTGNQLESMMRATPELINDKDQFEKKVDELFLERKFSVRLFRGKRLIEFLSLLPIGEEQFSEPEAHEEFLLEAKRGSTSLQVEREGELQYLRSYRLINMGRRNPVMVLTLSFSPELTGALQEVTDSYEDYEQLKFFRNPLRSGYFLSLAMITMMLLFAAIWVGFFLAKGIVGPIKSLAEGTRAVARGDYDFHVRPTGNDEIATLIRSFNKMTSDLKMSRQESERRRVYIETMLANLAVGVVGLDTEARITSVNDAASRFFSISGERIHIGEALKDLLDQETYQQIEPLLSAIQDREEGEQQDTAEQEIRVRVQGRELRLICTAGKIVADSGRWLGAVLLLDDITELSRAEQLAAWREVARRIAHEIKNPLTPIQLSAQRLEKLVGTNDSRGIQDSTQMIVEHVGSIKRLADEFSKFARMPAAELKNANLNDLISETLALYAGRSNGVSLQFIADPDLPEVYLDREQMKRVFMNLIDNALSAIPEEKGKIHLSTESQSYRGMVIVKVTDNGKGIPDSEKPRIFDPYFTRKEEGTGLGLAIVSSVIADHQGTIRVFDNDPQGTTFLLELPVAAQVSIRRRFSGGG